MNIRSFLLEDKKSKDLDRGFGSCIKENKKVRKKERKHALDQEDDQEKKVLSN